VINSRNKHIQLSGMHMKKSASKTFWMPFTV